MIVISKFLVPRGYVGITLFPFIVLKDRSLKQNKVLLNHERIHLRQQLELLVLPFYLIYSLEFLIRLIRYKNWQRAYQNLSFEREAYAHEKDFEYLKSRPVFKFKSYF